MNNKDSAFGFIGSGIEFVLAAIQADEVFQIITFVLGILTSIVTLAFTLYKWYKAASADGKITKEEIEEGLDILKDGIEDVAEKADNKKSEEEEK